MVSDLKVMNQACLTVMMGAYVLKSPLLTAVLGRLTVQLEYLIFWCLDNAQSHTLKVCSCQSFSYHLYKIQILLFSVHSLAVQCENATQVVQYESCQVYKSAYK